MNFLLQELEERLSREIEENPALESGKEQEEDYYDNEPDHDEENKNDDVEINVEDYLSDDDVPDYKLKTNNYSDDDEEKSIAICFRNKFQSIFKKSTNNFFI